MPLVQRTLGISGNKPGIVFFPLNTAHTAWMHSEIHSGLGVLSSVEIKHLDGVIGGCGEQMASVREADFFAQFRPEFFISSESFGEDIKHSDFIGESNDHVQPARVEGAAIGLFREMLEYFQRSAFIVPNSHAFVNAAGHEQSLAHTHVKTRDLLRMEIANH